MGVISTLRGVRDRLEFVLHVIPCTLCSIIRTSKVTRSACSEAFPLSGPTPRDSWLSPHTRRLIISVKRIGRARGNLGMRI